MTIAGKPIASPRQWAREAGFAHGRLWLTILLVGFLGGGLFFKSFVFVEDEPVVVNYLFNGIFIGAMLAGLLAVRGFVPIGRPVFLLLTFAAAWAMISSAVSGIAMNYVATLAMIIMLAGCFYATPTICLWIGQEPWRLLNKLILIALAVSVIFLATPYGFGVDPLSGRFSGFFISVAVACNFFFFGVVLNLASALRARTQLEVNLYIVAIVASLIVLYLTRTRSSLIEAMFCFLVLATFSPMRRGMKMLVLTLAGWVFVLGIVSGTAVSTGLVSVDEQLEEFRLSDSSLTDARNLNWEFGLQRIAERPIFGEGLLTKQTDGGTRDIKLGEGGSYNQVYDPHSLPLSLAVECGVPFMIAMMGVITLILIRFVNRFGLIRALQSPDFVLVATHFAVMMLAGGDLTTLGNMVDKVFWVLVGSLEIKNSLVHPADPRYRERSFIAGMINQRRPRAV